MGHLPASFHWTRYILDARASRHPRARRDCRNLPRLSDSCQGVQAAARDARGIGSDCGRVDSGATFRCERRYSNSSRIMKDPSGTAISSPPQPALCISSYFQKRREESSGLGLGVSRSAGRGSRRFRAGEFAVETCLQKQTLRVIEMLRHFQSGLLGLTKMDRGIYGAMELEGTA